MAIKNIQKNLQAGVTLIEMLVVVAIIALVSSVLIFNYSDFSTNVSVRNLSQEIALSVRKAQTYATSVRPIDNTTLSSKTFPGYGISFATSDQLVAPDDVTPGPRQFVLFADDFNTDPAVGDPSKGVYDYVPGTPCGTPSAGNECLESFGITTADKVVSICGAPHNTRLDLQLYPQGDCYADGKVDITFRRPSPDAIICMTTAQIDTDCSVPNVVINLQSAKGLQRSVLVWNTGQISVQ